MTTDRWRLVDISDRAHTDAVVDLLASAVDAGAGGSSARDVADLFRRDPNRFLAGLHDGDDLVGLVGGYLLYRRVLQLDVLAVRLDRRGTGLARRMIDAAADGVDALAIRLETDADLVDFYERCGFTVRPFDDAGHRRFRAERRHPPEPPGFFTAPHITWTDDRDVDVLLPPPGNTLPLLPPELRDAPIPAFVLRWVLDTHEVGLMLQHLHPDLVPPVTPAVRPLSVEEFIGPRVDPELRADAEGNVADLPGGVAIPAQVLDTLEMARRIEDWLRTARRVRRWAEANGHGDLDWIVADD